MEKILKNELILLTSPSTGMVRFVSSVCKFKSNHKVPIQVQVEPKDFSGFGLVLVWSGSGENFKSLGKV